MSFATLAHTRGYLTSEALKRRRALLTKAGDVDDEAGGVLVSDKVDIDALGACIGEAATRARRAAAR